MGYALPQKTVSAVSDWDTHTPYSSAADNESVDDQLYYCTQYGKHARPFATAGEHHSSPLPVAEVRSNQMQWSFPPAVNLFKNGAYISAMVSSTALSAHLFSGAHSRISRIYEYL